MSVEDTYILMNLIKIPVEGVINKEYGHAPCYLNCFVRIL